MSSTTDQKLHGQYQVADSEPTFKNNNPNVSTTEIDGSNSEGSLRKDGWKPGKVSQFPWMGILGLVGVLICSGLCVAILYISNGKAKSQWKIKAAPNVLLSILTSIGSILVTMAVGNGIAISWWRKAMKGATVEDLHQSWSFSSSIMSIVKGYKFFNVMALTALCTKFAIIDSTLFQKALTTTVALGPPSNFTVDTYSFGSFPPTGKLNQYGNDTAEQTFPMTFDMMYWLQSNIYTGINWASYIAGDQFGGCEGLCALKYRGVGFASSCSLPTNESYVSRNRAAVDAGNNLLLDIDFTFKGPTPQKDYSYIQLDWQTWSSYSDGETPNENCTGDFYHMQCELRPAILDYPIALQNTSISGRSKQGGKTSTYNIYTGVIDEEYGYYDGVYLMNDYFTDQQLGNFTIVEYLNVTEDATPNGNTSLGGIVMALNTYYKSRSTASYQAEKSTNNQTVYDPVNQNSGIQIPFAQLEGWNDGCPTGFTSPLQNSNNTLYYDLMLANINQLTLLVSTDVYLQANYTGGIGSYNGTDDPNDVFNSFVSKNTQNQTAVGLKPETYYYSKFGFAWGAFASTIVVVALILPSYWGYWQLGRKVTLGPLEIANAFEAPAFAQVDRNTGRVDHVLEVVGKQKVKYDTNGRYGFVHH